MPAARACIFSCAGSARTNNCELLGFDMGDDCGGVRVFVATKPGVEVQAWRGFYWKYGEFYPGSSEFLTATQHDALDFEEHRTDSELHSAESEISVDSDGRHQGSDDGVEEGKGDSERARKRTCRQ